MKTEQYDKFVREVFIAPIRSVLIVDDDYPTFDEILADRRLKNQKRRGTPNLKKWFSEPEHIEQVIRRFRESDRPLLVDIHDGSNVRIETQAEAVRHLHQSDLLVLDYQLDRTQPTDGTRAIDIARSVMKNDHFNLVVVHTSEKLNVVFKDMLIGVLGPLDDLVSTEVYDRANALVVEGEEDDLTIGQRLKAAVSDEHYFAFRKGGANYPVVGVRDAPPFTAFESICNEHGWTDVAQQFELALWALHHRQETLLPRMNRGSKKDITWAADTDTKWIRADSVFIAFSNKAHSDDLIEELVAALLAWKPKPSRLFLAKLRAELDRRGVGVESAALGSDHVLAHWYKELVLADGFERDFLVAETIGRLSEQLLDIVQPSVSAFAKSLVSEETGETIDDACKDYFGVDLSAPAQKKVAIREHNAFVCSKRVAGHHLATGHIFTADDEYWVCLTPMCDLVPGRKTEKRYGDIGSTLPFVAVRLIDVPGNEVPKAVQSNRYVFLKIGSSVKALGLMENDGSSPHWFQLYAANQGVFDPAAKRFQFLRATVGVNGWLGHRTYNATIVAQLRYEYALNLVHKLGSSMTRVGLDFASA